MVQLIFVQLLYLCACMLLACLYFKCSNKALPVAQPKMNVWVSLAKSAGSDTICLSNTSPDKPFSTCLVGVPFPDGFDNVTFDKYWPYDNHHLSPTPPPRHQTYIENFKVDQSDLEELEILGSWTSVITFTSRRTTALPLTLPRTTRTTVM